MPDLIRIRRLQRVGEAEIRGLSEVLIDCVEGGASVSFMQPLSRDAADRFWRGIAAGVVEGRRVVLAAENAAGEMLGSITLALDTPENQPHRADLSKMLVHRRARRAGVAARLLAAAERYAVDAGRTLLVLDTVTGSDSDRLYTAHGWRRVGEIPDYALLPDGRPCATTVFYKRLRRIRPYTAADFSYCLMLFDANSPEYFAPNERADYAAFLHANTAGYQVCVEGAGVVGAFGLIRHGANEARLNWILIDPRRQNAGIGSALMEEVLRQGRSAGITRVQIAASHKSAPFFARFGALAGSETPDGWGPGMHRIDMEWRLP